MRMLFAAALLATAVAVPALAETRDYRVGGFDRINSAGPWDVRVWTGRGPAVKANAPQDVLDRLTIEVRGGELFIGSKSGSWLKPWNWGKGSHTVIDVNVPALAGFRLSGPGDVTIDRVKSAAFTGKISGPGDITIGAVEAGRLDLSISGPGNFILAGKAGPTRVSISGPGDVKGGNLTVGDIDVSVSGPGTVILTSFGSATGTISGPGDVRIGGHPRCNIRTSGPGDVKCG